jgi:penicillin-binding protein 1A
MFASRALRRAPFACLGLALAVAAAGCAPLQTLSTQQALERMHVASTKLYASDGSLIANLHGEINRDIVPLKDISKDIQNAVIAIEDARFWTHRGVDVASIGRALVSNVGAASADTGKLQGGSTLSQQLVKNIYFQHPERTLRRKLSEARVSVQFEQKYSKRQILEMYLNTIFFGRGVYGIETASRTYFRKGARDLTLSEGAFLAGLIHEPGRYDWSDKDSKELRESRQAAAIGRRNVVLHKMRQLGFISEEQERNARAEPLKIFPRPQEDWRYPYFVDMVLRQLGVLKTGKGTNLDKRFDFLGPTHDERSKNVYRGGLRIYTTLDPKMQKAAEDAVDKVLPHDLTKLSAAVAAIQPSTGYIRAIVGGRDYYPGDCPEDQPVEQRPAVCRLAKVNLALGSRGGGSGRQPGSSFKPIVLATAVQRGVGLRTTFDSSPFERSYPGGVWKVRNYEGSGGGGMDLVEGTVHSVNAVYAHLEIDGVGDGDALKGSSRVAETARRLGVGFPTRAQLKSSCGPNYGKTGGCTPADEVPAIALGAKEVSPLEMASAYSVFANDGVRMQPTAVTKIADATGKVIWEANPSRESVLPRPVALALSSVMQQVIQRGTGTRARLDRPAAGKTGTSQEWRDAWFDGYVPQLAASVWVGNPIPTRNRGGDVEIESMTPANGYPFKVVGGTLPSMIWQYFMSHALEGVAEQSFAVPPADLFGGSNQTSAGPPADVPDVLGLPGIVANQMLVAAGFQVTQTVCPDKTHGEGTVVKQTPAGGSKIPSGGTVSLCVASRASPFATPPAGAGGGGAFPNQGSGVVPGVVGESLARAQGELYQAGYRGVTVHECDPNPDAPNGRVWKQSPEGGARATQGSNVTIWYSGAGCP